MSDAIAYATIRELGGRYRKRELSPVEVTPTLLGRIEQLDPMLHAFITLTADRAMADARAAEAALQRGDVRPLLGIPVAHKDIYCTRGIRTTGGSALLADWLPEDDATCVRRWQEAGTVLLGKLITHEFAFGLQLPGHRFLPARNPWNIAHIPGGSSSGSGAALAAGLCMGSLGSCTGGSIRGPAAYCSMVGLKPTYGRVSRYGVVPLSWSLDHCGPMTWTVEDTASMLQAIAGPDPKDPTSSRAPVPDYSTALKEDIKGLTIGVPRHFFWSDDPRIDRETLAVVEAALQALTELGTQVEEVTIPTLHYAGAAQP